MEAPANGKENTQCNRDAIDAILKLADASWRDFDSRRSDEWKVNFGLWTALGLFAGILLKGDVRLHVDSLQFIQLFAILFGIWCVHTFLWTRGLRERQKRNLESAHFYWGKAEDIVEQSLPKNVSLVDSPRRKGGQAQESCWLTHWSHGSQILTTTFLIFLVLWCVLR